ncbi:protein-glutamate O-methyltransferase CheR [Rhodocytophaga rosea]|uniref:Protein-glutamate O-methyltransferase CheR n=1 Tax=Rhodocytophaga rosea TaxID=2704465 RepID=A0A6C0GII3_9BACT|nr:protein-glutamate O-methyltransferase CheR [Rhodocytophaga rosea]QHT67725.1 protein-glutamate O-methyltransferase CheR [Rhodocytophaga rosea]
MVELTNEELNSLNRVILTRYGIDFTSYETGSFKRRVARAISVFNLESVHSLWAKLLKERDFIYPFIDELTVGLTAMFRDPILWISLKKVLRTYHEKDPIHIWHAGCSTGEEVFTMGILLDELNLASQAKALATDLNQGAVKAAREGKYRKQVMDEYIQNFREYNSVKRFESYYTPHGDTVCFNQSLIRHVEFQNHNLIMDKMEQKFDIIFCRNVMIYFDTATKLRLLQQFYDCLNPGGYFIIGFYDALVPLIDEKKFEFFDLNAKIFRKI